MAVRAKVDGQMQGLSKKLNTCFYTPQLRRRQAKSTQLTATVTNDDINETYHHGDRHVSSSQNVTASQDGLSLRVKKTPDQYNTINVALSGAASSKSTKKTKTILTELFVAASIGDAPAVDFFLRIVGVAVDAADVRGWRPIHHASLHGQTKVVELLIRRGANVNCCTVSGITPILLSSSCLTPRLETMAALLDAGANPNMSSQNGTTPLMEVCCREHEPETEGVVSLLLMRGADTGATDAKGRDAIAYARSVGNQAAVKLIKKHDRMAERKRRTGKRRVQTKTQEC